MQISTHVHIQAPADDIFRRILAVETWPDYIRDIKKIEVLTPGPVGLGTRFRETRLMFGQDATEDMEIAEIDPPKYILLTAESHGTRYRAEHILTPDSGGTRVELIFGGQPVSLGAKLMSWLSWLLSNSIKTALAKDLQDLKAACEGKGNYT